MKNNRVFLIADLHFGHENIIKYENRPFKNIDHMDAMLIKNWNSIVSNRDTVIVAGDFSFYGFDKTKEIVSALNGKKVLIKGNHDQRSNKWFLGVGFDEVSKYPILYKEWFVMQHEPPMYMNDATPYFLHIWSCAWF